MDKSTFLYFAYGSNLLTDRIRINNPSARVRSIALLRNHKLDFNNLSKKWGGAVATIIPHKEELVWGVLWELDMEHQATLDKQEGVPKVYNRKEIEVKRLQKKELIQCVKCIVQVELENGTRIPAITYFMVKPEVEDKRPSKLYHQVRRRFWYL